MRGLFCQIHDKFQLFTDAVIILPPVGNHASAAVLNAILCIGKVSPASISQSIQRAEAKQAAEFIGFRTIMAGKILAFLILKKIVMTHLYLLCKPPEKCYNNPEVNP